MEKQWKLYEIGVRIVFVRRNDEKRTIKHQSNFILMVFMNPIQIMIAILSGKTKS